MGLCKCERRKVTNLFCFEHRVNVCEFCLISNHTKCIVKSYLHWLKDSDFSSICSLCSNALDDEYAGECVRLMCLDVFHWRCLNKFASELPVTTAPAGYECPSCSQYIIPLSNQGGPVAEALRTLLETAVWMKRNIQVKPDQNRLPKTKSQAFSPLLTDFDEVKLLDPSLDAYATKFLQGDDTAVYTKPTHSNPSSTVVPIDDVGPMVTMTTATLSGTPPSLKRFERQRHLEEVNASSSLSSSQQLLTADGEDEKYRRRTPMRTIGQTLGLSGMQPAFSSFKFRRHRIIGFIGLVTLVFFVLMLILNIFNDPIRIRDPLLDPMLNPEIHVVGGNKPQHL